MELLQLRRNYEPMIVQRTLMVHHNQFAGVLESYEANVLFVINSIVGEDWPGYEVITTTGTICKQLGYNPIRIRSILCYRMSK